MEDKKPILNFRASNPLKSVSINQHIKQPAMNKQLTIEDKVMRKGLSPRYKFTAHNHYEIIDIIEKNRIHHKLSKTEISNMAGMSDDHYSGVSSYGSRFSKSSYGAYKIAIDKLNSNTQSKPVYEVKQALPVYKPTPAPSTNNVELTEEMCINFLKATGNYKICKSEVTTNWIEL